MPEKRKSASPPTFDSFGGLLKYLRRRARLTQRELGIAVGYSEAHVSRIEHNHRLPDSATVAALFVPALDLEGEPEIVARLLGLAASSRDGGSQSDSALTISSTQATVEVFETSAGIPTNLPLQLTSFVGRKAEISEITRLLSSSVPTRLLTLTGPGGIGKTRLAIQTAFQLLDSYPDGIWFIDLAPLQSPELLPPTVASTLGVTGGHGRTLIESLAEHLRPKSTLLVLDNCEHMIVAAAHLVEKLLRSCPRVRILATSREPLNLQGEVNFRVLALSVPAGKATARQFIVGHDAVELFTQRAQSARASFKITDDNAPVIARVCRRLDGMPLAIELAAARVNLLRVEQIEARLDDRFHLLTGGHITLPRHQTLLATIEWSYDLLEESERVLFRRLSVFSGGWTLEASNAVCSDEGKDMLDFLTNLVNKSLVVAERQPGAEARYTYLETIHAFAREKLEAADEAALAQKRHFDYFFELAAQAKIFGPDKLTWLNRLEAEHDNFRSALRWSLENDPGTGSPSTERVEKATFIIGWLADYYFYRGYSVEARKWLDQLLAIDLPPSPARAIGFQRAGFLTRAHGDFDEAISLLNQGLAIAREVGDSERAAWAYIDLGGCMRDTGKVGEALADFSEALNLFQELKDDRGTAEALYMLAETYEQGNELKKAISLWEQGLTISRQAGDKSHISWGLEGLGGVAFLEGRIEHSSTFHKESLKLKVEVMDKAAIAYSFEGLAQASAARRQYERAAILWGAAGQMRDSMNLPLDPSRRHVYVSLIPSTRENMETAAFEAAQARGRAWALDEAINFALHELGINK